tara:strand:- start:33 stop:695 length:663 start_codon:yes stop_codon:yes gene_type:complete
MTIPFWFNDPSILLNKKHLFVIWPNSFMTYEEKLNAITRLVILLSVCGYILTSSQNILITSLITIICIVMLYKMKKKDNSAILENLAHEGFTGTETFEELKDNFQEPTVKNPLQNMEQTVDNVEKKPAAPSFNKIVNDKIKETAKEQIQENHPDFPDINKKLFRDLGEHENFENSMRPFYSMPNTRMPNDQKSFSEFCYGDISSKKEENEILIEDKFIGN